MLYTDGIHLIADTVTELHEFAASIGMKHGWFQDHRHPHYDLFGSMVEKAIKAGAIVKDTKELVLINQKNIIPVL